MYENLCVKGETSQHHSNNMIKEMADEIYLNKIRSRSPLPFNCLGNRVSLASSLRFA